MALKYLLITFFLLISFNGLSADLKIGKETFRVEKITEIDNVLWGFDFIDENKMVLNSRAGQMYVLNLNTKKLQKLSGLPQNIYAKGQGGLLDVFFYKEWIYFTYAEKVKDDLSRTTLAKAQIKDDKLSNLEILLASKSEADETQHYGSRVVIKDDVIYFSVGERKQRPRVQDLNYHNGKILRLNLDGTPHKDNPFQDKGESAKYIYSYGHRNPQGLCFDDEGNLYEAEMGPRGGDEVNLVEKGKNYGWPIITYGKEYWGPSIGEGTKKKGVTEPVVYYVPSISPSGCTFVTKDYYPGWKGSLLLANLSGQHLRRVAMKEMKVLEQEVLLKDMGKRFRAVKEASTGEIYFSTDDGKLYRIERVSK